jgi:hypothetical protein
VLNQRAKVDDRAREAADLYAQQRDNDRKLSSFLGGNTVGAGSLLGNALTPQVQQQWVGDAGMSYTITNGGPSISYTAASIK